MSLNLVLCPCGRRCVVGGNGRGGLAGRERCSQTSSARTGSILWEINGMATAVTKTTATTTYSVRSGRKPLSKHRDDGQASSSADVTRSQTSSAGIGSILWEATTTYSVRSGREPLSKHRDDGRSPPPRMGLGLKLQPRGRDPSNGRSMEWLLR